MNLSQRTPRRLPALSSWLALGGVCAATNAEHFFDNGHGNSVSTLQHPTIAVSSKPTG
jgi:hypothetical protein